MIHNQENREIVHSNLDGSFLKSKLGSTLDEHNTLSTKSISHILGVHGCMKVRPSEGLNTHQHFFFPSYKASLAKKNKIK